MKVSILIASFQADPFIGEALASIRAQTHSDWELIVVEDGSHDTTEQIVHDFAAVGKQPVIYQNLGQNRGVAAARNRLLELATGEAVAFLDADDIWEPTHLELAVAHLMRGADLVVSGIRTFDLPSNRQLESVVPPSSLTSDPVQTLFRRSVIQTSSAVVLRRSLAQMVGAFDAALRIGEDRDYWLRCALAGGQFASTRTFTCHYAKHLSSSMARTYVVAEHTVHFYEKHLSLEVVPASLRRRLLADSLICLGRLLREHDPQRSAAQFWRAWHLEPFNPVIPIHLAFSGWRAFSTPRVA